MLVGFVYSAIFLPKRQNQITFRTMLKNFNMKNFKMRLPVLVRSTCEKKKNCAQRVTSMKFGTVVV